MKRQAFASCSAVAGWCFRVRAASSQFESSMLKLVVLLLAVGSAAPQEPCHSEDLQLKNKWNVSRNRRTELLLCWLNWMGAVSLRWFVTECWTFWCNTFYKSSFLRRSRHFLMRLPWLTMDRSQNLHQSTSFASGLGSS